VSLSSRDIALPYPQWTTWAGAGRPQQRCAWPTRRWQLAARTGRIFPARSAAPGPC